MAGAAGTGIAVGVAITAKDMYSAAMAKASAQLTQLRKKSEVEAAKIERSLQMGKSMMIAGAAITAASTFNSTMVRWECKFASRKFAFRKSFNSTMVRWECFAQVKMSGWRDVGLIVRRVS